MNSDLSPVIVWFRQDLRVADNPALIQAAQRGPVLPVYILDDETPGRWAIGGAGRWWLHHSLCALKADLDRLGSPLLLRKGPAAGVLADLVREIGAAGVYWNRSYEPFAIARDKGIKRELKERGIDAESFAGSLLFEPWEVRNKSGEPFKVFTPFWRACLARPEPTPPLPAPERLERPATVPGGDDPDDWDLLPRTPDWAGGLRDTWQPGEAAARRRLTDFLDGPLADYASARDLPGREGTSRLSPHLHWGEISPRQIWRAVRLCMDRHGGDWTKAGEAYLRELIWREFSYSLLFNNPTLPDRPLDRRFEAFAWTKDDAGLDAWRKGRTGYPIVDAGMRQLWRTGWMHNRVRMIVGSFLIKHLLLPWQDGENWFWDTLVDADLANNAASWQWIAGCGADAAPFFRIFNPVLQGEKFDPAGEYVRAFVPELQNMPDKYIHKPWEAPPHILARAKVILGDSYPKPIIDHRDARQRALAAFDAIKTRE